MQDSKRVLWTYPVSNGKTEEFNFFNMLSNDQNFVLSNCSKNLRNVIQMALKRVFFQKNAKNRPVAGGFASRLLFVTRLSYTSLLTVVQILPF